MKEGKTIVRVKKVYMEVSIKEIARDCERTTQYPEVNCGQPESYTVCEDIPAEGVSGSRAGKGRRRIK